MNQTITSNRILVSLAVVALAITLVSAAFSLTQAQTATSTPVISSIAALSSLDGTQAQISWTTDQTANSQVAYGLTSAYNASSTLDSALVTNHVVFLGGLVPDTLYHFQVLSQNASGTPATSSDQTFMTSQMATTTPPPNGSTTDAMIRDLQDQIDSLPARISALEHLLGTGAGTPPPGTPPGGPVSVTPSGITASAGSSVDFNGRNFGREESVTVMLNGQTVATAHADGGGNFSTGSLSLPMTPGVKTYLFHGALSGINASSTITVQ